MASEDMEKTALVTSEVTSSLMSCRSVSHMHLLRFERMMGAVLRGLQGNICLCYLDVIVVYSPSFSGHLRRSGIVLFCLLSAGLRSSRKKSHFACRQIKVLGPVVPASGVS